jgi:hypothetical protein
MCLRGGWCTLVPDLIGALKVASTVIEERMVPWALTAAKISAALLQRIAAHEEWTGRIRQDFPVIHGSIF